MPIESVRSDLGFYKERTVKAVYISIGETVTIRWESGSSIEAEFTATTDLEQDMIGGLSDAIVDAKIAAGLDDMWSTVTVYLTSSTEIVLEWEATAGELLAESTSAYPFTTDDLSDAYEDAILMQLADIPESWESRNSLVSGMLPLERIPPATFHEVSEQPCQGYPRVWLLLAELTGAVSPTGHAESQFYLSLVQVGDSGNGYEFIWESETRAWVDAAGGDWDPGTGPLWRLVKDNAGAALTCWIEDGVTPSADLTWEDDGTWDCFGSNSMVNTGTATDLTIAVMPVTFPDEDRVPALTDRDVAINGFIGIDPANSPIEPVGDLTGIVV